MPPLGSCLLLWLTDNTDVKSVSKLKGAIFFKNIISCLYKDSSVKYSKNKSSAHHSHSLSLSVPGINVGQLCWHDCWKHRPQQKQHCTFSFWVWAARAISCAIHQGQGLHCSVRVLQLVEMSIIARHVDVHFGWFVQ